MFKLSLPDSYKKAPGGKRFSGLLFGVVALVVALPPPAQAFEYSCADYKATPDPESTSCPVGEYVVDENNTGCACNADTAPRWAAGIVEFEVESQGNSEVTAGEFAAAAETAAAAWSAVSCANLQVRISTVFAADNAAGWGGSVNDEPVNQIFMVTTESEWTTLTGAAPGGVLGLADLQNSTQSCATREFNDTDIIINGAVDNWTPERLTTIIMHEIGHALGLGHSCVTADATTCPSNGCDAVMAALGAADELTVLSQDDIDAICSLYPRRADGLGDNCPGTGSCDSGTCVDDGEFSYCSRTCDGTTACTEGFECRGGFCLWMDMPMLGEACTGNCVTGTTCFTIDGAAECRTPCEADAGCGATEVCAPAAEGNGGACVAAAARAEDCSLTNHMCLGGLRCINDRCELSCLAADGGEAACGGDEVCVEDGALAICMPAAAEGGDCTATGNRCQAEMTCVSGLCRRPCSSPTDASCGADFRCAPLSGGGGFCLHVGEAKQGDSCENLHDCAQNLVCLEVTVEGAAAKMCMAMCDSQANDCAHSDQQCTPFSETSADGFCFPAVAGDDSTTSTGSNDDGDTSSGGGGGGCRSSSASIPTLMLLLAGLWVLARVTSRIQKT